MRTPTEAALIVMWVNIYIVVYIMYQYCASTLAGSDYLCSLLGRIFLYRASELYMPCLEGVI